MPKEPKPFVFTIYKITCIIDGKFYIGKHKTRNPNDYYMGSSPELKADIEKYGKQYFKKEILFTYKTENRMKKKEKEIVTEDLVMNPECYNIRLGG